MPLCIIFLRVGRREKYLNLKTFYKMLYNYKRNRKLLLVDVNS